MSDKKKIFFLTSSRADYGKMRSLAFAAASRGHDVWWVVTGMHLDPSRGSTFLHVQSEAVETKIRVLTATSDATDLSSRSLSAGLSVSHLLRAMKPDMLVVHGDRPEALGAAQAGFLTCSTLVAHVEGGHCSGNVDDAIRHAITKMAHVHFVTDEKSAEVARAALSENHSRVYVIGSPDLDALVRQSKPGLDEVVERYPDLGELRERHYGLLVYHPRTPWTGDLEELRQVLYAIRGTEGRKWIAVYPNDDPGGNEILKEILDSGIQAIPSMRFDHFASVLANAAILVGNSSCGIMESPYLGVGSINIGHRQNGRSLMMESDAGSVLDIAEAESSTILRAIESMWGKRFKGNFYWGDGSASEKFGKIISRKSFWNTPLVKEQVVVSSP